jgi:hypothetical protein
MKVINIKREYLPEGLGPNRYDDAQHWAHDVLNADPGDINLFCPELQDMKYDEIIDSLENWFLNNKDMACGDYEEQDADSDDDIVVQNVIDNYDLKIKDQLDKLISLIGISGNYQAAHGDDLLLVKNVYVSDCVSALLDLLK